MNFTHSVRRDRWDREDHSAARKQIRAFARARVKINESVETGTEAVDDLFCVLLKADPQQHPFADMTPRHRVNHFVIGHLMPVPAVARLRDHTVGDRVLAALACVDLVPRLEAMFDRLALAFRKANRVADRQHQLDQLRKAADDIEAVIVGMDDNDPALPNAVVVLREHARLIEDAERAVNAAERWLVEELGHHATELTLEWGEAVSATAATMSGVAASARAWGIEPGQLRAMPAGERLELARRLNDERLRAIADLFGRVENLALSSTAEEIDDVFEEISDLELGSDLSRVTPTELLMLGVPEMEERFLAQWCDGQLTQYQVHGTEESGRGGIVMCIDGSMSMHGPREIFAKALMLVLLHTARRQRRRMHVIHFGYRQIKRFDFLEPSDFTSERIIEAAQAFFGSGTDFEQPMTEALNLLELEWQATGRVRADVVFVSDDEYHLDPQFLERYLCDMHEIGARTWGVLVDRSQVDPDGALALMSEGRVFSAGDLDSGRDVRAMLTAVR